MFTQRWAPGACADWLSLNETASCYEVPTTYWTIHGLWPSSTTGNHPAFCNDTPLNVTELVPITNQLVKQWPTTRNYTNNFHDDCVFFWEHEWDKHGTCALSTVFEYFNASLELNVRYDVFRTLERAGIVPEATRGYNYNDIFDVLLESFGKTPEIACTAGNLIHEVRICLDKESSLIDCSNRQTNCDITQDILYR